MFLIFDTETSGFPSNSLERNHPNQARIVQLGMLCLDECFREVFGFKALIKLPEGKTIHESAFAQHGISLEMCKQFGIPVDVALVIFGNQYYRALKVIGHNLQFDCRMIQVEDSQFQQVEQKHICTMELMTPICKLPKTSNRGAGDYKWPKLQEAYQFVTDKPFDGAHDALADVRATSEIFKWLVSKGYITL